MSKGAEAKKTTHGVYCEYTGKDGIDRRVNLFRLEDSCMAFRFETHWDGRDREPMVTDLVLGVEALNHLVGLIAHFNANREKFLTPKGDPTP